MSKYNLTHFGEIDLENLEEYYETEITVEGRQGEVDINFDEGSTDASKLNEIGLATIQEDYKSGETVREYIEHHMEELDEDDLSQLLKSAKGGATKEEKILSAIKLKRIGFYPQTEERFFNLDYTLEGELTDYLVVLDFTEDGKLHYITTES